VVAARSDELAITYRGVAHEARRSRSGLLLQPGPGDGELLGLRLPRTRSVHLPGRGVLALDQPQLQALADGTGTIPIQVAQP
jgi:S-DNA-T family DNA segregation ATPase FtsK/SpoIIIE